MKSTVCSLLKKVSKFSFRERERNVILLFSKVSKF